MATLLLCLALFCLSLAMPLLVAPLLRELNLMDIPNHRSSHTQTTLRGAGIAVAATIVIGLLVGVLILRPPPREQGIIVTVAAAVVLTTSLGFIEDTRGISVKSRLLSQYFISLLISLAMLQITDTNLLWSVALGMTGVFLINAANFMDGINGISSLHGILLGLTAVFAGFQASSNVLVLIGTAISIAFCGFLPWNFPGARLFLGDAGSYLVGGLFLAVGYWIFSATDSLFLAIAPAAYYTFDVLLTLSTRAFKREALTEAHREHLYQRFQRKTDSHVVSTLGTTSVSTLIVVLAFLSHLGLLSVFIALVAAILILGSFTLISKEPKVHS